MINKEKNVTLQVTFPKEDAEHLKTLHSAFNEEGIKVTKSDILVHALREYIKTIVLCDRVSKAEDKKGDKENA